MQHWLLWLLRLQGKLSRQLAFREFGFNLNSTCSESINDGLQISWCEEFDRKGPLFLIIQS